VARRRGGAADLGHDVRGELGLARGRIDDDDGALGYRLVLAERRLDLAELDAEPAELDLAVTSAAELEQTVASPPADVARPVQAPPAAPFVNNPVPRGPPRRPRAAPPWRRAGLPAVPRGGGSPRDGPRARPRGAR